MASKFMEPAKALIKKHEGVRLKPYYDSEWKVQVGPRATELADMMYS